MADTVVNVQNVTIQVGCATKGLGTTAIDARYLFGWFSSSCDAHSTSVQAICDGCIMPNASQTAVETHRKGKSSIFLSHTETDVVMGLSGRIESSSARLANSSSMSICHMVATKVIDMDFVVRTRSAVIARSIRLERE